MSYLEPLKHDLQSPFKSTIHLLSEVEANALYLKTQTNKFNNKEEFLKPLSTGDREKIKY